MGKRSGAVRAGGSTLLGVLLTAAATAGLIMVGHGQYKVTTILEDSATSAAQSRDRVVASLREGRFAAFADDPVFESPAWREQQSATPDIWDPTEIADGVWVPLLSGRAHDAAARAEAAEAESRALLRKITALGDATRACPEAATALPPAVAEELRATVCR